MSSLSAPWDRKVDRRVEEPRRHGIANDLICPRGGLWGQGAVPTTADVFFLLLFFFRDASASQRRKKKKKRKEGGKEGGGGGNANAYHLRNEFIEVAVFFPISKCLVQRFK